MKTLLEMKLLELLIEPLLKVTTLPALVARNAEAQTVPPLTTSWLLPPVPRPTVRLTLVTKPPVAMMSRFDMLLLPMFRAVGAKSTPPLATVNVLERPVPSPMTNVPRFVQTEPVPVIRLARLVAFAPP
ncbi:MAG: hypothetical protein PCFJNLEI_04147 [Verrucomicrobiae bacterium]|nr:hypothetical protein [Verrucomicrobiae bacterium]